MITWYVIVGAVVCLALVLLAKVFPDFLRYLRIRSM